MARTTTDTDDDLDPSLRSTTPGTDAGTGDGDRADAGAEDGRRDPPSRDDARLTSLEQRLEKERDERVRAETLLQAMQRQNQGTGPAVKRPPEGSVEAQYFDLFQTWMQPQLEAAGVQIERVMTNMADRNDKLDFEVTLLKRGIDPDDVEAVGDAVERIRTDRLAKGTYISRADALKIHEGERGKKVGRRRASGAEDTRVADRNDERQDTDALRNRAKHNATLPNDAAARNRDQRGSTNQKPDSALSIEEFEQRYPDAWL